MKDVDKTYENVISGGLKLKGKVISKSKASKSSSKTSLKTDSDRTSDYNSSTEFLTIPSNSDPKSQSSDESDESYVRKEALSRSENINRKIEKVKNDPNLTNSEKTFKIAQIKRTYQRIQEILKESHKQKIEKFNAKLSSLSEHFDIPKVGPG